MPRRPQPTTIKKARGNPGKRALPKDEPQMPANVPPAPSWLSPAAREAWASFGELVGPAHLRVMTDADRPALEMVVTTYARWRRLTEYLEANGDTYPLKTKSSGKDGGPMQYPRPEVAMCQAAHKDLLKLLVEFGMTPSARTKVTQAPPDKPASDDPWKLLDEIGADVPDGVRPS